MNLPRETVLEINLDHLKHNFEYLKSRTKKGTLMMAVVKASGYGSDAINIAKYLEEIGVDYLAVAYTQEGIALRNQGVTKPILVLHPQPANFEILIDHRLEPSLYSIRVLEEFIEKAISKGKRTYPIQLKFNTGLNRIGFSSRDIETIVQKLKRTDAVKIKAVLSHLAASEDLNEKEFTLVQIQKFKNILDELNAKIDYSFLSHQCNTSGILNFPEAHFDMVRSGIGLYGFGNDAKYDPYLKPIASLKSVISQIHHLEKGESVGYNRAFKAEKTTRTATIPIGHADGIGRIYGNKKGFVMIKGQKAPIIGNVCMDMIMVDITPIDCKEGDLVIIFDESFKASKLAEDAGTISYELITAISPRIKRRIIES